MQPTDEQIDKKYGGIRTKNLKSQEQKFRHDHNIYQICYIGYSLLLH